MYSLHVRFSQLFNSIHIELIFFRGLILSDLTFIHIGNSDFLQDDRIVNFWKRWQQFTILHKLRYCRKWFVFKKDSFLKRDLSDLRSIFFQGNINSFVMIEFFIFSIILMTI